MFPVSAYRYLGKGRDLKVFRPPLKQIRISYQHTRNHRAYATSTENLPRVAQPSVWHSIIPKAFRKSESFKAPAKTRHGKDWNPATFFIWIFLLIGSNAIQMITLRNEYSSFSRKADAKIKLLKEVLDKVQRGEKVDVEKVLGTGDPEQEQEWHDVIKNIEEEDRFWESNARRREKRRLQKEHTAAGTSEEKRPAATDKGEPGDPSLSTIQARRPPGFY